MIFAIQPMCRASGAFKIEVLKNAYKKIWAINSIAIVKNKQNVGLKNLKFKFLAIVGQFKFKKNANFFSIFFISYQTIPLVSLSENIPYFIFLPNDGRAMSIYNFLLLRPCTLVVLQRSQNRLGFFINSLSSF